MFQADDIRRLNTIFRTLATSIDIGRGELLNGCEYRAAQARILLEKEGYTTGFLLLRGDEMSDVCPKDWKGRPLQMVDYFIMPGEKPYSKQTPIAWSMHIAACVRVRDTKNRTVLVVLDPGVCDGPVRLRQYLQLFDGIQFRTLAFKPRRQADASRLQGTLIDTMMNVKPEQRRFAVLHNFRMKNGAVRKLPSAYNPYRAIDRRLLPVMALKS